MGHQDGGDAFLERGPQSQLCLEAANEFSYHISRLDSLASSLLVTHVLKVRFIEGLAQLSQRLTNLQDFFVGKLQAFALQIVGDSGNNVQIVGIKRTSIIVDQVAAHFANLDLLD